MSLDARPTVAAPDDDPYLWLEDIEGERALAWVEGRTSRTRARFAALRALSLIAIRLPQILNRADKLPFVARRGAHLYNFWVDAANPRGLWRRTTLASFRTPTPAWDVVLDVDALAAKEGEDWIGRAPPRCPARTTVPSCACHVVAAMPRSCANSTSATRGFVESVVSSWG